MGANGRQDLLGIDPQMQARRPHATAHNMRFQHQTGLLGFAVIGLFDGGVEIFQRRNGIEPTTGLRHGQDFRRRCKIIGLAQILRERVFLVLGNAQSGLRRRDEIQKRFWRGFTLSGNGLRNL